MKKIRTHYDNLQVTETASQEVIRGAYKFLSQKYHPDRFNGDPADAERVMKIINRAYQVLSDPERRARYDEMLADSRASQSSDFQSKEQTENSKKEQSTATGFNSQRLKSIREIGQKIAISLKIVFWIIAVFVPLAIFGDQTTSTEEAGTRVVLSSAFFIAIFLVYHWVLWVIPTIASSKESEPIVNKEGQIELWSPRMFFWGALFLGPWVFMYLNKKNWVTLGKNRKAEESALWMYLFIPAIGMAQWGGYWGFSVLVWIFSWLLIHNRQQYVFIRDNLGDSYVNRSFNIPALFVIAIIVAGLFFNSEYFSENDLTFSEAVPTAMSLTDDIVRENYEVEAGFRCTNIIFQSELSPNHYLATALFSSGEEADIEMTVEGDYVTVIWLE
jgi:predicted DNA-binding protein (MmcQ/YjbR family)